MQTRLSKPRPTNLTRQTRWKPHHHHHSTEAAADAVSGPKGRRSERWRQPPSEFGDLPTERVMEWSVECDTRIPWPWSPVAVEDERKGDERSYCAPLSRYWRNGKYCFHGLRQNLRILIVASKETGIEVNADKTKYTDMCRNQNTGGSHSVKTDNRFFKKEE